MFTMRCHALESWISRHILPSIFSATCKISRFVKSPFPRLPTIHTASPRTRMSTRVQAISGHVLHMYKEYVQTIYMTCVNYSSKEGYTNYTMHIGTSRYLFNLLGSALPPQAETVVPRYSQQPCCILHLSKSRLHGLSSLEVPCLPCQRVQQRQCVGQGFPAPGWSTKVDVMQLRQTSTRKLPSS